MNKVKTIELLNTLIQINNDRIDGYQTASKETEETDLKTLFTQFAQTSQRFKQELIREVHKWDGKEMEATKTNGKTLKGWLDIKTALAAKNRKALLDACELGEEISVDAYSKLLRNNIDDISIELQTSLMEQKASLEADHAKIKGMLDLVMEY